MPVWHLTVKLGSVWRADLIFPLKRDAVVEIIKASGWRDIADAEELDPLLEELAETLNLAEFDSVFNDIYDLADRDRVWIETCG